MPDRMCIREGILSISHGEISHQSDLAFRDIRHPVNVFEVEAFCRERV